MEICRENTNLVEMDKNIGRTLRENLNVFHTVDSNIVHRSNLHFVRPVVIIYKPH